MKATEAFPKREFEKDCSKDEKSTGFSLSTSMPMLSSNVSLGAKIL